MSKNAFIYALFGDNIERHKLLLESILRMANQRGAKNIFVIHNILPLESPTLPDKISEKISYIRAIGNPVIWQKEPLYNLGAKVAISSGFDNLIFVDSDILPEDNAWLEKMEKELATNDWVHGGRTIYYLNKETSEDILASPEKNFIEPTLLQRPEFFEIEVKSRIFNLKSGGETAASKGFPGGIWGVTKTAWEKYKCWDNHNLVGGGDLLHFNRLVRRLEVSNHTSYGNLRSLLFDSILQKHSKQDPQWKVGYVDTPIYHLYHGNLDSRGYESRYKIFLKPEYQHIVGSDREKLFTHDQVISIDNFVYTNKDLLLEIDDHDEEGTFFLEQMANYFKSREDIRIESLNKYLEYRGSIHRFKPEPEKFTCRLVSLQ